ncbi:TonB-dependent siderophore receptor [Uliginosibacterium sediminicola]|uniref:TonB-dependent siderophore receptor n=1 Tax=Uliginosibacterium sediminicola TaxID=2024550 RepID=A0ABU9YVK3_9RHOO
MNIHQQPTAASTTRLRLSPLAVAFHIAFASSLFAGYAPEASAQGAAALTQYDIPSGPLAEALNRFAQQSGVAIAVDAKQLQGLLTRGLKGRYSIETGFESLLRDSGFAASKTNAGYVLRAVPRTPAAKAAEPELPAVTVRARAEQETATGPVSGYVAKRSATGTKTDTPIIETPQSITVISREQMTTQATQTVGEALRYTSGVLAEQYGGTDLRIDQFMLRGYSSSMPYLDGLTTASRYTLLSENVEPYGLERVEVLRGPSSVLYGQNIPGGLVSLQSKRPTDEAFGEVGLQTGNYGRAEATFDLGGPLGESGQLSYRLTGLTRNTGTQVDEVDSKRYYLAPSLTWKPTANTRLTVLAKIQRQEDGYSTQYLPASTTLNAGTYGRVPTSLFTGEQDLNKVNRTQQSLGYSLEHSLNSAWTFRQNLRLSQTRTDIGYVYAAGLATGTSKLNRYTLAADAKQLNLAVDTQAESRFRLANTEHKALIGVDYFRAHDHWSEQDGDATALDILNPVYGQSYTLPEVDFATEDTLKQIGLYLQDQVRLGAWSFTGGLRRDQADTKTINLLAASTTKQTDRKLTGRLGLVYLFDNGFAPYASYSTSFTPTIGTRFDGSPFKPTTARQAELGLKYQAPDAKSFITTSLYQLTQQNGLTSDPDHLYYYVQTGEVQVRGAEVSSTVELRRGLSAIAAYTLMDAEITKSNDGYTGKTPKDVPRQMASLWLDQKFGSTWKGMQAGAGIRYIGYRYGSNDNSLRIPANTFVDAMLGYTLGQWSFALNVRNLFDKVTVATCDSSSRCVYGLRRSVIASSNYRW